MSGRILVFGDIHGEYEKFMGAWEGAKADPAVDELIFLGDYIDRGPEAKKVLDFLMGLSGSRVHLLMGNHEKMCIGAANTVEEGDKEIKLGEEFLFWYINGGSATFEQISKNLAEFRRYVDFMRTLPLCYEKRLKGRDYFFCHGGVRPGRRLGEQEEQDLLWIREPYISEYRGEVMVVTGHTPTCYMEKGRYRPLVRENQIFMDTGSYMQEGKVSCMDLLSGEIWQG